MGRTGCAGAVWLLRVVYRNAEFPFPDVYCDHPKYSEHHGEPDFCLCVRHEGGRGCDGNTDRPIWGLRDGRILVVGILSEAAECSCLLAKLQITYKIT